ncbi:serine aminopeptidase domain-containing protein [Marinimicrobium sp. ABcell2]|uniref:serine aminopeptidase domain-containing protein n=1 Tax=Marinimicrobium sp. ABcell2 TaxID=3069751 RepID=UPI0027B57A95|nr:alpha/beta hydrolase [Marinimicrobium sp. ABcell2]MDQ2076104.1 alpha/beta hydrolase [Marinimicrobium sp. ABcell2]
MRKAPLLMLFSSLLTACGFFQAAKTPMPYLEAQVERQSDTLLIMLPGRKEGMESFPSNGFFATGNELEADIVAVDAHFGYYRERTVVERLHQDIIVPARARGYKRIWLMGVSMGGLGAVLYCDEHPGIIDGLILLAPYPGDSALVREIHEAGGLDQWPNDGKAGEDYERAVWHWFKEATRGSNGPQIVLGYGEEDRFAKASELLAVRLPAERVFTQPGGHNWDVWRALWSDIVAAGLPAQQHAESRPNEESRPAEESSAAVHQP